MCVMVSCVPCRWYCSGCTANAERRGLLLKKQYLPLDWYDYKQGPDGKARYCVHMAVHVSTSMPKDT